MVSQWSWLTIPFFPLVFHGGGRGDDSGGGSGADWEHILYLCSCQVLIYFFSSLHFSLLYTIHVNCVLFFCRKCRSDKSINCSMSASLSLLGNSFAIFLLAKVFFCRRNEPAMYLVLVGKMPFSNRQSMKSFDWKEVSKLWKLWITLSKGCSGCVRYFEMSWNSLERNAILTQIDFFNGIRREHMEYHKTRLLSW